ncbi:hypothetical protein ANANG_G00156410 [Anguilla anguilla]|uniref:Uncharacterized protein n=1 Tax=Anguilla anguilla TaxID=7936 RepID=A0A9D3RUU9_ANGAN|nr:hypothetical protein ANANG_G00156410 [Anguilla anguilla]
MADELDRVRISAAELRAGASNLINHEESLRDGRDERRSQRQREGKRPDLQRYQPTPGHTHRQRDGGEAAKQAPQKPDQPETAGESPPAADAKMEADAKAQQGSADTGVRDADCCQDASRGNCLAAVPKGLGADRGQLSGGGCGGSANPRAPKAGADLGGRHDSLHRARNDSSGSSGQQQDCPDPIANASVGVSQSPKPARRVRKPDREIYQPGGRRSQHQQQGARDTASGKEEPKKVSQAFKDDGEREDPGGGKQREDRTRVKDGKEAEAKKPGQKAEQGKGKREPCDTPAAQESSTAAENLSGRVERLSIRETEQAQEARGRPQLGSKASLASKRYSKSDKRRPRTYSTSSASSGTSMDGPADRGPGGKGVGSWPGSSGKDRGERREDWGRGHQPQQNRRAVRDFSSTDSLEECETGRQGGRRRAASERDRFGEEDWSPDRRPREGRAHRGGPGPKNAVGGILRVSFDKPSAASHESSDDPHRRAEAGPRGRGRGILILPAHTNITASPEPGPRLLVGGARGGVGQGRARGGRGGALRRLWDPNNPDQKPALTRGQQFQQSPHLQQGGYGQLHFLDTDDEAAGSPPVRQGDPFQNFPGSQQAVAMNAAAMAFYKFQNSDNPYCYPMASNASSRYPYPYHLPYQIPSTNGIYPGPATASYYAGFGQAPGSQGYPRPRAR